MVKKQEPSSQWSSRLFDTLCDSNVVPPVIPGSSSGFGSPPGGMIQIQFNILLPAKTSSLKSTNKRHLKLAVKSSLPGSRVRVEVVPWHQCLTGGYYIGLFQEKLNYSNMFSVEIQVFLWKWMKIRVALGHQLAALVKLWPMSGPVQHHVTFCLSLWQIVTEQKSKGQYFYSYVLERLQDANNSYLRCWGWAVWDPKK